MLKKLVMVMMLAQICASIALAADPTISVSSKQRYPWNGLVDLQFTITGTSGTKYDTSFTAKDMVGGTNIAMRTIRKSNGVAANVTKEQLTPGTYKWVWDAAADLPNDWKSDRVTVTGNIDDGVFTYFIKFNANGGTGTMSNESFTYGTAKALTANAFTRTGYTFQGWSTSASGAKVYNDKQSVSNLTTTAGAVVNLYAVWEVALYMVIDLSGGANASSYPVSYLDAVPSGGWSDTYKTTKLVLRRVEAGTFKMCGQYNVTLTKPFFIGVFEVTQKQYSLVMGSNPSDYKGDNRPVEQVTWEMIRGNASTYNWPNVKTVGGDSFAGRISKRTGLSLDLPTEAQWEYASRAGTTSLYNNGGNTENDLKKLGRYSGNTSDGKGGYSQHTVVGSYVANAWGLYDMHGNNWEWCLDWYGDLKSNVTDPVGPSSGGWRVFRGGSWHYYGADACQNTYRYNRVPSAYSNYYYGFRVCMTLSN